MSNAPATQSFSWALPTSEKKKAGENEYRKPIVNPLMKKAPDFANGVQSPPHLRYPLASVDNTSLRRRNTSSTKKDVNPVFLPPKLSLTVDGAYMDMPVSFRFLTLTLTVWFYFRIATHKLPPPYV
jgi:Nup53/35/40-type RNA recognition motif